MLILHFLLSSAMMTLVVFLLAVTSEIFPKAITASHRYVAWMVILVGFIFPFRPFVGGGLVNLALLPNSQAALPQEGTMQVGANLINEAAATAIPFTIYSVALAIWLGGALFFLAYYVLKHVRFMRIVKRWSVDVTDEAVLAVLDKVREEKGVAPIGLKKCGFVSTSMLVGFFRPLVLLPDKEFDTYELELIFRHELVHYRRKDLFVKLLSMFAVSIHWFNPSVYLMSAQMQADCETSCDETVLAETGEQCKMSYAELIIEMIGTKRQFASSLSTCFYGSKRSIKKRMSAIMESTGRIGKLKLVVVFPVLAITVLSGSVFTLSEQEFMPAPAEDAVADEAAITMHEAINIAQQVIEGGVAIGISFDEGQNAFTLEVIRGSNKYFLTVRSDGSVTIDQTISIFEPDAHRDQYHGRHGRRGRMWRQ